MAADDLVLAALASKLIRPQTATQTTTPTPTAGITSEQLQAITNAVRDGVVTGLSNLQLPPINVSQPEIIVQPPNIQIPQTEVSFPSGVQLSFSDAELDRLASAVQPKVAPPEIPIDILNRSVQADLTGAALHALVTPSSGSYPNLVRLASIQFMQDVNVVGVVLSASLLNTGTEPMGLFVARDTVQIINFSTPADPTVRANDIYLSILTHNNSTVGTNAPASRTSSIGFSPKTGGIPFKSASAISIYGCAQNLGSALLTGVLSIYYIPVTKNTGG